MSASCTICRSIARARQASPNQPAATCAPAPPSQACSSSLGAHQNGVAPNQPSSSAPLTSTLGLGQANPINHSMSSYVLHAPYSGIRSRQALVAATRTLGPWHQHEPWQWFSMAFHCCTMRPVAFCLALLASLAQRRLLFSACVAVIVSCPVLSRETLICHPMETVSLALTFGVFVPPIRLLGYLFSRPLVPWTMNSDGKWRDRDIAPAAHSEARVAEASSHQFRRRRSY